MLTSFIAFEVEENTCDCGQDMRRCVPVILNKIDDTRAIIKGACGDLLRKVASPTKEYVILEVMREIGEISRKD